MQPLWWQLLFSNWRQRWNSPLQSTVQQGKRCVMLQPNSKFGCSSQHPGVSVEHVKLQEIEPLFLLLWVCWSGDHLSAFPQRGPWTWVMGRSSELLTSILLCFFLEKKNTFVTSFLKHKETAIKQRRWEELMACSCSKSWKQHLNLECVNTAVFFFDER